MSSHELGYFGNIWVRQNVLSKAGNTFGGHKHHFDHVSLLTKGSVTVKVNGSEPKNFIAPTFIIIRKDHEHEFIALEDGVNWYCVFALRDLDGNITDIYGENHDPLSAAPKL